MTSTANEIRQKAERAMREFEDSKAKLYRADGTQLYGPEEHKERMKEIVWLRDASLDRLKEEAGREAEAAEAEAAALRVPDLTAALVTTDETTRAANRYTFISEEVAEMDAARLQDRVKAVIASGDKPSLLAHARAIRKKAAKEHARRVSAARRGGASSTHIAPSGELEKLAEALEERLLGSSRKEKIEAANKRAKEYQGAAFHVGSLRSPYRPNHSRPGNLSGVPRAG